MHGFPRRWKNAADQEFLALVDEAHLSRRISLFGYIIGRLFPAAPTVRMASVAPAALIVLTGSGLGIVQSSEDSPPDSPLYQVKEAREWAELALTGDSKNRLRVYNRRSERRDHEQERAVQANKPGQVSEPLMDCTASSVERTIDKALESSSNSN